MRVLIISARTGGGHESAMHAIAEALRAEHGARAEITAVPDVIERTHPLNRAFCALYNALLRHRPGWVAPYARLLDRLRPHERALPYRLLVRRSALDLLARAAPDAVVSVHPMANHHMARALREAYGAAAPPLVTVVTDPVGGFWPAWACEGSALVVAATGRAAALLREIGAARGFPADWARRVRTIGLPVPERFHAPPREDRAAVLAPLGLDPARPLLLATAGWAGESGRTLLDAVAALREAAPDVQVALVCGRAEGLLRAARRRFAADRAVAPLGFVEDPSSLGAASFAVFTKPGGLTVAEAIALERPILVNALRPLMPQEAPTADWIADEGMGAVVRSAADLPAAAAAALDPGAHARMRSALRRHRRPDAAREIARAIGEIAGTGARAAIRPAPSQTKEIHSSGAASVTKRA